MQKSCFRSKVEVLRARQSKRPVMSSSMGPLLLDARMPMRGLMLLLFCAHRMFVFAIACVLCLLTCFLHSQQSFISYAFLQSTPCRLVGCTACSCRRTASKCRFCAYNLLTFAKTVKITNPISSCLSKATYNHAKTLKIYIFSSA